MLINSFEVTMHIERCRFLHTCASFFHLYINQIENLHLSLFCFQFNLRIITLSAFLKKVVWLNFNDYSCFLISFSHCTHCTIRKLRCRKHWLWILLQILLRRFLFKIPNEINSLARFCINIYIRDETAGTYFKLLDSMHDS